MKRIIIRLQLAIAHIALDQAEREQRRANAKCEELTRREIELRIRHSQCTPLRRLISYPGGNA